MKSRINYESRSVSPPKGRAGGTLRRRKGHVKNEFAYNDKELIEDGDLGWYDYGFRFYDAQIGRFPQLDPLAFDYPYYTPYQYAGNEPIANIDLDGLEPFITTMGQLGEVINRALGFTKVGRLLEGVVVTTKAASSLGANILAGTSITARITMAAEVSGASYPAEDDWQSGMIKKDNSGSAFGAIGNGFYNFLDFVGVNAIDDFIYDAVNDNLSLDGFVNFTFSTIQMGGPVGLPIVKVPKRMPAKSPPIQPIKISPKNKIDRQLLNPLISGKRTDIQI